MTCPERPASENMLRENGRVLRIRQGKGVLWKKKVAFPYCMLAKTGNRRSAMSDMGTFSSPFDIRGRAGRSEIGMFFRPVRAVFMLFFTAGERKRGEHAGFALSAISAATNWGKAVFLSVIFLFSCLESGA